MDYLYHYNQLVETRKTRVVEDGVYYERHHIKPVSLGGTNCRSNLVCLTGREHYIAHLLLYKIYPDSLAMLRSFVLMSGRFKIGGRVYEEARIKKNATMPKKENHSCWGKKKPKMSEWMRENSPMKRPGVAAKVSAALKGRKLPKATKDKMKGRFMGAENVNYTPVVSTNTITGEVITMGLSATAIHFKVDRELIQVRVRGLLQRTPRKLKEWVFEYGHTQ